MTIKANTIKANTIKANTQKATTIKAETIRPNTITSSTPKNQSSPQQRLSQLDSRLAANGYQEPASTQKPNQPSSSAPRAAQSRSLVSFTASPPPAPPVPPTPPKNLAELAHSPGALTQQKRIDAQQNFKPVEDIITAQIVGNDFSTGMTKVKDGSGNIYDVQIGQQRFLASFAGGRGSAASVVVGQSVVISRARSQSGERVVRLISIVPLGQSPNDALGAFANNPNVNDLCKPSGSASVGQSPKSQPEDPQDPEVPAPPLEPNPNEPDPEPDPPSKPFGCNPTDDAQWFNGSGCPAGLESLGFAQLSDGSTKTLCRGPNVPPGDGCPESPDEYGWICVSGTCEFVPFGLYTTKAECEGNCSNDPIEEPEIPLSGFSCLDGSCIEDLVNPQFDTLDSCNSSRTPIYGDPPFNGGQCPDIYLVNYRAVGDTVGTNTGTVRAVGPIGGARVLSSSPFNVQIFCSGINISVTNCGPLTPSSPGWYNVGLAGSGFNGATASIDSVSPCAPPDDCGDIQGPLEGYTC